MSAPSGSFSYVSHRALPELVFESPRCSQCRSDVEIEDGVAYCNDCLIRWDDLADGAVAVFDDSDGEREPCGAPSGHGTKEPYDHDGRRYEFGPPQPCTLPEGHYKSHLHPYEVKVANIEEAP